MKLYKNLVNAVGLTLQEIFTKNRHADKALEKVFKQNPQWGSRDRRFVAEGVYDIVRNYRLYAELAESKNNFWFITAVWLVIKEIQLPNWPEFQHVDAPYILSKKALIEKDSQIALSYPDWLWLLCEKELSPHVWKKESAALNEQASVFLRVNSLKSTSEKVADKLLNEKIETIPVPEIAGALRLKKRENIFKTKSFREGYFEVQDAGSQMISIFLNPQPNEVVIDACAGAGGKSLHISALMKNKGKIYSLDVEAWKLDELKKRAKRGAAFNIETRVIVGKETIEKLFEKADRLLLDVPCSGLGVLKRNPDAKWKLSEQSINETKALQKELLQNYSKMLKISGVMVYSTCSILPSENELQVKEFLNANKNFSLLEEKKLLPSNGFDGFYMASLKRLS